MKSLLTLKNELDKLEKYYKAQKKRIMAEKKAAEKYWEMKKKKMAENQKKTAKKLGAK